MLQFSPSRRVTAEQALRHEYLAALHDEDDEPSHVEPSDGHDIEQRELDWPMVKELVRKEVQLYQQESSVPPQEAASATAPSVTGSKRPREQG